MRPECLSETKRGVSLESNQLFYEVNDDEGRRAVGWRRVVTGSGPYGDLGRRGSLGRKGCVRCSCLQTVQGMLVEGTGRV